MLSSLPVSLGKMMASAGYSLLSLPFNGESSKIRLPVFFPSSTAESLQPLGPFTESVALDGELAPGPHFLVVVSHGTGSMPMLHRGLAIYLARRGFVVALPEHPGNSRTNDTLSGTAQNLGDRPRHLRRVVDWLYQSEIFAPSLVPDAVAMVGHSLGAYTVLACAGGRPTAFSWETADHQPCQIEVLPEPRLKAAVLLAPTAAWFIAEGALRDVDVPILMLSGDKDDLEIPGKKSLPDGSEVYMPFGHSHLIQNGVRNPEGVEHRVIPNAGHYSFLSPYPASMRNPAIRPSQDPQGFDRDRFYEEMSEEVFLFLTRALGQEPSRNL
jgi:predicted dienelactone hydrolase